MIRHVWSQYPVGDADSVRRHLLAQSTWAIQGWQEFPVGDSQLPRLFPEGSKRYPYVKDLIDKGCEGLSSSCIVVLSNADIGFCTNATVRIVFSLQSADAGYTFRKDAHHRIAAVPSNEEFSRWADYPGTDVFWFRVSWWNLNHHLMPDQIVAHESWDACMRVLIEATNPEKPLSLTNLCWHERHGGGDTYWENAKNRYTLPGQLHNLSLARVFLVRMGYNPAAFGIR